MGRDKKILPVISGDGTVAGTELNVFARITGWVGQPPIDREQRLGKLVLASLRREGLPPREIMIRNISINGIGARIDGDVPLIGERVLLDLMNLKDVRGTIRWVKGNRFGIRIDDKLDPHVLCLTGQQEQKAGEARPWEVMERFRPEKAAPRPGLKIR